MFSLPEGEVSRAACRQLGSIFQSHVYIWWSQEFRNIWWYNFQHSCMKMVMLSLSFCRCKSFPDLDEVHINIFQLCVGSTWCRVADISLCSLSVSSSLTFSWLELLHLAATASSISACATVLNVVWWRVLLLLVQTIEEKVAVLQYDRSSVMRQNCSRFVGLC